MKSKLVTFVFAASLAVLLTGCGKAPAGSSYRVYVSNEASGDLTVIDPVKMEAVGTAPLGKRARGLHPSADGKLIFVALSGSPFAPPGVDESTLPPADKSKDGIGVFDVAQNKMLRKIPGGSDPEQFAIAQDGKLLFVSNEDAAGLSSVDPSNGQVLKTLPTGKEPEGVTLSPDDKLVYVTSEDEGTVAVVDIAAGSVIKKIKVGRRPRVVVFLPDGSRAYVTNENDCHADHHRYREARGHGHHTDGCGHEADGHGDDARWGHALRQHRTRQEGDGGGNGNRADQVFVRSWATAHGA